ncbi:hypothetical protein L1987_36838 [Smallanthus sonchifolius]|uniref:Uncharacterized protein n=1 Tax=Smallanthus sonchifolius TaxID=185202 RepID=A0ACB9HEP0_9ASTR|nr:hypothetical protein L1987_36838 [Smallanthus sonchifolius]
MERDRGELRRHHKNMRTLVILRNVFSHTENRATRETPLLVHHEAFDQRAEAEEFGEPVVGTGHVDSGGGAEDEMGDVGFGFAPFLMALTASSFPSLGTSTTTTSLRNSSTEMRAVRKTQASDGEEEARAECLLYRGW